MRTLSPLEIAERIVETYPFEGDWQKIMGEPDIRFSTLIRGEAKSGKSTYAAKFAQYISQFGRVLYVSAEERLNSKTLQNRLQYCGVVSPKVRFVHDKDIESIERTIKNGKYRFVIFDSVQNGPLRILKKGSKSKKGVVNHDAGIDHAPGIGVGRSGGELGAGEQRGDGIAAGQQFEVFVACIRAVVG